MQAPKPFCGYHFLVVEDEWLIQALLTEMIQDLGGISQATAYTLDDALRIVEGIQIDCAILDVKLGQDLSFPIAATLQKAGIPFIFCSAYGDIPTTDEEISNVPCITKPVKKTDLVNAVLSALVSKERPLM